MPRRQILSESERALLFMLPDNQRQLIQLYTFSQQELSLIRQYSRGASNRVGFAVQLCYMRYPGMALPAGDYPDSRLLSYVCTQLNATIDSWEEYGKQIETRRDHISLLRSVFGFKSYNTLNHYKPAVQSLEAIKSLLAQGKSVKDVADAFNINPSTVYRNLGQ